MGKQAGDRGSSTDRDFTVRFLMQSGLSAGFTTAKKQAKAVEKQGLRLLSVMLSRARTGKSSMTNAGNSQCSLTEQVLTSEHCSQKACIIGQHLPVERHPV